MKFSFGSSFTMAPGSLDPVVLLGSAALPEGEPAKPIVLADGVLEAPLTVEVATIDVGKLLSRCELSPKSVIAFRLDLDCPGFNFVETLLSCDLPSSGQFSLAKQTVAMVPRPVVVQGFSVRASLVVVRPAPSGLRGCSIPGGIVCSWESKVPSRNRASLFPVQDSIEPALWRLDIDIDDAADLDRPLRAALRLFVDSERLERLLGHDADPATRQQAIRWLQAESFTALVCHVLANDEVREQVSAWLATTTIEKSLDPKSVGHFVVRVMRRLAAKDLSELHHRLTTQPLETTSHIRSKMAVDLARKGGKKPRQVVSV